MNTQPSNPAAYSDLPWAQRLAIMKALEAAGSALYQGYVADGFTAAIGRGKLHATHEVMAKHDFVPRHTVTFPLGTDQPAEHLRHDAGPIKSCQWLLCTYVPRTTPARGSRAYELRPHQKVALEKMSSIKVCHVAG